WALADGAPFTAQDVRSANKVCIIGRTTASQIYGNDDPVGQILRIKNVPFTVTGILTPKGLSTQGVDQDDVVIMPFTSAMKREVGTRMAVGAHGNDILMQFLIEAVTLSSVGGVIGIVFGIGASKILSSYAHWPTLISLSSIIVAFMFSAAVGIFFGFYPARKAAALDPIEALRYE